MHYHLEIIMPPVDDVESMVAQIMKPFDENCECEYERRYSFWDFYVIGGRWAGDKLRQSFDADTLDAFYERMKELEITVSGLQCGKQSLSPVEQIPVVDAEWRKFFPDGGEVCPLFAHYNDQYKHSDGHPDIMRLEDIPESLTASHVIIAAPNYQGEIEAEYMIRDEQWNGVTHVASDWDGKVSSAIDNHLAKLKNMSDDARERYTPRPDWLVITVDYHS